MKRMWIEVLKIASSLVGGFGSGVLLMVIKERRDKKNQLEAEERRRTERLASEERERIERLEDKERQVLKDLLTAISSAKRLERPKFVLHGVNEGVIKDWHNRHQEIYSALYDLLSSSSNTDLRTRLRNLDIISPPYWAAKQGEIGDVLLLELERTQEDLEATILEDAYRVVLAVLREGAVPSLDESSEIAQAEQTYITIGGEYRGAYTPQGLPERPRTRRGRFRPD